MPILCLKHLQKLGGGGFTQPLMATEDGVGFTVTPNGIVFRTKTVLGYSQDCLGNTSVGPVSANKDATQGELYNYLFNNNIPGSYNNMGVPGAKSFHLLPVPIPGMEGIYSDPLNGNPFYARFANDPGQSVIIYEAIAQNPTFFSLWIGSNDVLGYATAGGVGDTITGQNQFAYFMDQIVGGLTTNNAKGVISNLPGITGAAFFNTIPPNGYVLTQGQADTLNLFLGGYGFSYNEGPNYFIIADTNSALGFRQMVEGERVLLTVPQDSLKCAYWGGFNPNISAPVPIPDQYVLTLDEITNVNNAITGYNSTIQALATQYNLAFVDINGYFEEVQSGITFNGETFTVEFVTGGVFSLDGIHLTKKR